MGSFNQKEYMKVWQKENYKQFKTNLKIKEMEEVNSVLKSLGLSKANLIRFSIKLLKNNPDILKEVEDK